MIAGGGYLINRTTWSLYLGLTALVGAVTILALPPTRRIEELAGSGADPAPFFAGALLIAFGVFAMNLGQGERRWNDQFRDRYGQYLAHIAFQLLLGLLVTAPGWLMFKVLAYVGPLPVVWGGVYLLGYGFVLATFGLVVGTLASEIAQFQLKYLCFVAYLAGSFFWPPSSPLFNLVSLLDGRPLLKESAPGLLILAGLGGVLLLLAQRRVKLWKGNSKGASYR